MQVYGRSQQSLRGKLKLRGGKSHVSCSLFETLVILKYIQSIIVCTCTCSLFIHYSCIVVCQCVHVLVEGDVFLSVFNYFYCNDTKLGAKEGNKW